MLVVFRAGVGLVILFSDLSKLLNCLGLGRNGVALQTLNFKFFDHGLVLSKQVVGQALLKVVVLHLQGRVVFAFLAVLQVYHIRQLNEVLGMRLPAGQLAIANVVSHFLVRMLTQLLLARHFVHVHHIDLFVAALAVLGSGRLFRTCWLAQALH